jgi:integrase
MAKRNSFYNEEIYKLVHKDNLAILKDYTLELKSKRKAEKTIYQYSADIKAFFCWAFQETDNNYILKMKKRDFRRFFLELQDSGASTSRINRVQCSLRNLLEFASMDDDEYEDYQINAMKSIKGLQKEEVREIFFLTDVQITTILDALIAKKQFQKALYLSLSYDSAGRRNEVFQVAKDNFLENKKTNTVQGKRGKKFQLLYLSRTKEIAALYFDQRGTDKDKTLWTVGKDEEKRPAKYETLYNWVLSFRKILEKETGEFIEFNPHSLRHSALENYNNGTHHSLKELGKDKLELKVLKVLANHTDISTTESYLPNKDGELLATAFGI